MYVEGSCFRNWPKIETIINGRGTINTCFSHLQLVSPHTVKSFPDLAHALWTIRSLLNCVYDGETTQLADDSSIYA